MDYRAGGAGGKTEDRRLKTEDLGNGSAQPRPPDGGAAGLWGKIRWSDVGEDCVRGGRDVVNHVWSHQ